MLSEILEAYAPQYEKSRTPHAPGLSMSSLYPCPYRLYLVHTGQMYGGRQFTPQQLMNMADGNDQEEQSVRRLAAAGVKIENRQREVFVGKSKVPGRMDGTYVLRDREAVWEHKAYDQNTQAVWFLTRWGMDKLPGQRAQTNGYMLGSGLEWCCFFVKVKNNNTYIDLTYQIDHKFIDEIVEWCDKIRLENWKPKPKECKWCSTCNIGCFDDIVDFSWIASADSEEMVKKWKEGKQLTNVGEMLMKEADEAFLGVRNKEGKLLQEGLIGDKEMLILPGLEIKKSVQSRFSIDKSLVLQEFGPEGLVKVGKEKEVVSYRHKET